MKKLKPAATILGVIIAIFVVAGIAFSHLYEEKVKKYILQEINSNIATKANIENIEFSVFKEFPYASLVFKKIEVQELTKSKKKGTLFTAQSIYLQFNIIDVLQEDYNVKKVVVNDGAVHLNIDSFGNDNYHFWKNAKGKKNPLIIKLEQLRLKNIRLHLLNSYKKMETDMAIIDMKLSGDFSEKEFELDTRAKIKLNQLSDNGNSIISNKKIDLSTVLSVNQVTRVYQIKKGETAIEDLKFSLSGSIVNNKDGIDLNLKSEGENLKIEQLISLLPNKQKEFFENYKTEGIITYSSQTKGIFSAKENPNFKAEFSISNGSVTEKSSRQSLTNINLTGNFTNGNQHNSKSSQLHINLLQSNFEAGSITGSYALTDFTHPYVKFKSQASINIAAAKNFFKIDTLEIANGDLEINLNYEGHIDELKDIKATTLKHLNANGTAQITNASFKLHHNNKHFKNIDGLFKFNNNNIKINRLKFNLNNNNFELDGNLNNALAFFFIEGETIKITSNFYTNKLVLEDFLNKNKEDKLPQKYAISLPKHVVLNLNAKVDTFEFRKFFATNLKGEITLKNNVVMATNTSFYAMKGNVKGNIIIDNSKTEEVLITGQLKTKDVAIDALFYQFENFGQQLIKPHNIKGLATTEIEFASVWDKALNVNKDKIYVLADVSIHQGELVGYKPLLAMGKYIAIEDLKHIKFSSLTTQIEVKNQILYFPKTAIQSTALDLTFYGTHTFSNEMDYHFKLLMSDILWNKAKKHKQENAEFGYIEDDGLGKTSLFLHLKGTMDDYKINYDSKGLKEDFKQDLKQEKTTLKTILNKEFGWFKKDTTLNKETKKEDGFRIEWEEATAGKSSHQKKDSTKKAPPEKKKRGLKKLIDKISKKSEEEEFEEFDDL